MAKIEGASGAEGQLRQAFGVDPSRPHRYSLRQARYEALATDLDDWAADAAAEGRALSILDVGCGWGILLRYLEARPHFDAMAVCATELSEGFVYRRELYRQFFVGDLARGYHDIPSDSYDVVVCEQVLEHLDDIEPALATLVRVLKPGGRLVVGVPIFPPPLHLLRRHVVPLFGRHVGWRAIGSHRQAFSLASFRDKITAYPEIELLRVRGFRIVSGGLLRPLENCRWWWRVNRRLGELIPAACIEAQFLLRKALPAIPTHQPRRREVARTRVAVG